MIDGPHIIMGDVMHKRLTPKTNAFSYGIFYIACPISRLRDMPMAVNRWGSLSFHERDHGPRDGSDLQKWIRDILEHENIPHADGEIILITLPRVFGYVFNPISFWFCLDKAGELRAVLCEVNNTFGERHCYICAHADRRVISRQDDLAGEKFFHVSPFLNTEGSYRFRFHFDAALFGAWIDHHDADGNPKLLTSLCGKCIPMTASALRFVFWRYPLITLKAIMLIHWQALKLLFKGIKYVPKPPQREQTLTSTNNITKM